MRAWMLSRGTQREPTSAEREAQLRGSRELAAGLGLPRNNPVLKNEGQGLSKKQSADLQRAVEKAMLWCKDHGGAKYEDPDFPPSARAIYGDDPPDVFVEMPQVGEVAPKWKRPAEFAPEAPVLTKLEYQVENIRQGAVNDRWLISAINIVSSNTEQLMRAFLDPTKAADGGRVGPREKSEVHAFGQKYGFFACRLYHDDPLSDDDWAVVIVDDRVPLSALDGRPCFASHPDPSAYWGMILEKAAAKLAGSCARALARSRTPYRGHAPAPLRALSAHCAAQVLSRAPRVRTVHGARSGTRSCAAGRWCRASSC